ncbi:MAG: hypothetical protein ABJB12_07310 [Pseudomonadota bacterium]
MLEELDESQLLEIDRAGDLANCSITGFCAARRMRLDDYNVVAPIENAGEQVTAAPDIAVKK